jgi:hypothetical protein
MQDQMAERFQTSIPNVSMQIRNIFREAELREESVVKDLLTTAANGKRYQRGFCPGDSHRLMKLNEVGNQR